ncbi:MAG: flagellar biosynthesis anti-sigma factor FlgM [bacterium]
MKIDRPNDITIGEFDKTYSGERIGKSERERKADQAQRGERINAAGDRVNISSEGAKIQQLKAKISEIPDVRQELVDKAKQDLESGNYQVDSNRVAHAIILESLWDNLY